MLIIGAILVIVQAFLLLPKKPIKKSENGYQNILRSDTQLSVTGDRKLRHAKSASMDPKVV